jgi:hypothetical protein
MPEHYPTNPNSQTTCQECGGSWHNDFTCRNCFHQLLYWENENPALGTVHHLMVLSYHLQHPSLYSPEGLQYSLQQLIDFLKAANHGDNFTMFKHPVTYFANQLD